MKGYTMRTAGMLLTAVVMLALTPLVSAEDELPIPADEYVYCTVCHGVQLMGNPIIEAPRLSGMEQWYVERQMLAYKKGLRGVHEADVKGMEMRTMAAALSNDQITEVAAYVADTRSDTPPRTIAGNVAAGRDHYATCYACHGVNGEGNRATGGPALAGLDDWYLVKQLKDYRDGSRGTHPDDVLGLQMRAATLVFLGDDEAIYDVVSYITTLQNN
jgi:cytochrome c oxidase subunit 2